MTLFDFTSGADMALIDDILNEDYIESLELDGEQYLRRFSTSASGYVYRGTYEVMFYTEIGGVGYTQLQDDEAGGGFVVLVFSD